MVRLLKRITDWIACLGELKTHEYRQDLRVRLQLRIYWLWCRSTGRKYYDSPYGKAIESGRAYHVTKAIPGLGVRFFGWKRTFWIIIPMPLKCEPIEPHPNPGASDDNSILTSNQE